MPLYKKNPKIAFCPRDMKEYFHKNYDKWYNLNAGKTVDIPADEAKAIGRYIVPVKAKETSKVDASEKPSEKKSSFPATPSKSESKGTEENK